jgi:hypothetical protein
LREDVILSSPCVSSLTSSSVCPYFFIPLPHLTFVVITQDGILLPLVTMTRVASFDKRRRSEEGDIITSTVIVNTKCNAFSKMWGMKDDSISIETCSHVSCYEDTKELLEKLSRTHVLRPRKWLPCIVYSSRQWSWNTDSRDKKE